VRHLRSGYLVADTMGAGKMANVKAESREDRLKAALRENLKRRKAQARGRKAEAEPAEGPEANGEDGKVR
jgi:hypothetical protein